MIGEPHHLERCFMSDQGSLGARIQAPTTIARSLISTDELLYRTKVPKTKVETQHQNKKKPPRPRSRHSVVEDAQRACDNDGRQHVQPPGRVRRRAKPWRWRPTRDVLRTLV